MPLNPDAVGTEGEPIEASWTSKDALLYAVGIGAGTSELAFTTENTADVDQRVFPTFPVVIGWGRGSAMRGIGTFNPAMLVHGQQAVTLHRPIPVEGTATLVGRVVAMYDKGKAAVVVTETDATMDGAPLFTTTSSAFIRGEGGWGGDRGPSGPQNVPPERDPDHQVTYQTSPDQALVYRLSGDRNPLHSDPWFARELAGFPKPILHGLCTYGVAGRALVSELGGGDATKVSAIAARFTSPVFPGETLTTSIWRTDSGRAVFRTEAAEPDGSNARPVLEDGAAEYTD
jgi:acyl dehydratase